MADLKLTFVNNSPDITLTNEKPDMTDGLFNAVFISLFVGQSWVNRICTQSERYVSTLPEIMSEPLNSETPKDTKAAAENALAWMVDDGIADEIIVNTELYSANRLNLSVKIVKPDTSVDFSYALNWDAQEVEVL